MFVLLGVVIAALCGGYIYHRLHTVLPLDAAMQQALSKVSSITSYSQVVETQTRIGNRTLHIVGTYDVDTAQGRYASYSTTTLCIGADPTGHSFTHDDIALGHDVYLKIDSADPLLRSSMQRVPQWEHFTSDAIPQNLTDIAIAGPIQDNIAILGHHGDYLSLLHAHGLVQWGDASLVRYTFTLSRQAASVRDGPLNALIGRVGPGTIDVWIDPQSFEVRHLLFTNPPYISTTTISGINTPPSITAPLVPAP